MLCDSIDVDRTIEKISIKDADMAKKCCLTSSYTKTAKIHKKRSSINQNINCEVRT